MDESQLKDQLINALSTQIGNLITQNAYSQLVINDLHAKLQQAAPRTLTSEAKGLNLEPSTPPEPAPGEYDVPPTPNA